MEFEDILKDVGGFGAYQKMLMFVFIIPTFIILPWFRLGLFFTSHTPEHWCYVPEIAHSNLSLDLQKQLIRPQHDSSCSTYDINYTQILHSGNLTVDSFWPTKECDRGWQYDTTNYDATAVTKWNLVCEDTHYNSLLLSMIFVGAVFGTPVFGFFSDKFGRKRTFFCLIVVVVLSEIGSVFSPYFALFLIFKALVTSVTETMVTCGYVISLELVNTDFRSWINGLVTTSWTVGICLLPLLAWMTRSWVRLSTAIASCAALLTLYWKLLPESPRWLLSEDRFDEAHDILVKINKMNGKTAHKDGQLMQKIKLIGDRIKNQKGNEKKHSPLEFFKHPNLRRRFFLIVICWIGISNTYYGLQINVKNLSGNEFLNFFLVSVTGIPSRFVTWILLDRIGRKWTMMIGFTFSSVVCLIAVFTSSAIPMIDVIASFLAQAGMNCCFMTIYQHSTELFPTSLRCQGMAMGFSIAAASTLVIPYVINLTDKGNSLQFLIFCITTCIGAFFASFLPETLNQNLPQTVEDVEISDKNYKWFSSCRHSKEKPISERKIDQNSSAFARPIRSIHSPFKENNLNYSGKDIPVLIKWNPTNCNASSNEIPNEAVNRKHPIDLPKFSDTKNGQNN